MTNNEKIFQLAESFEFDECAVIPAEPFYEYKAKLDYDNYGKDFSIKYNPKDCNADGDYIIVLIKSYNPYDNKYFSFNHIYVDSYYVTGNACYFKAKEMAKEIAALGYDAYPSPKIPYKECAFRAGFGKRGMNSLLVNEKYGSYMHIQCILTNMPLQITNNEDKVEICSQCNKCTDACKGRALDGTSRIEVKSCIRHYMPAKRYVPKDIRVLVGSIIGCTDCRASCPTNQKITSIKPPQDLLEACYIPILIDEDHELHKKYFKILQDYLGTNEVRKFKLLKSIVIVIGNIKDIKYLKPLYKLKNNYNDKDLIEYIEWAIEEIEKEDKSK